MATSIGSFQASMVVAGASRDKRFDLCWPLRKTIPRGVRRFDLIKLPAQNPQVEVRIDATFVMADFDRDPFDLGVRTLFNAPVGLNAELLLRQKVRPYCSPAYYASHLAGAGDGTEWNRARLLHESHPYD